MNRPTDAEIMETTVTGLVLQDMELEAREIRHGNLSEWGISSISIWPPTPEYEDQRRTDEVERQRVYEGRNGGGMICPACKVRGIVRLDEERGYGQPSRYQCGVCHRGVNVRVANGGLQITEAK